jgi:hypothetical protein
LSVDIVLLLFNNIGLMPHLPTGCPSCHGALSVSRLVCGSCQTQLEGSFDLPRLLRLAPADLEFVVRFVRTSGSLKAMAKQYGQSYPTIRNRLNTIIEHLGGTEDEGTQDEERHRILDALAKGTMTLVAAERRLKALS